MYTLVYVFLMFLLVPYLKIKSVLKGYSFSLKERFVLYKDKLDNTLWFHCASVGELNTVRPIYDYYKDRFNILITVSSPRGKKYAVDNFPKAKIRELPFDITFLIKRFINIYNPKALIIVEEELWLNLIKASSENIPVVLINGRISPSSFKVYKFLSFIYKKIFSYFKLIIARSKKDADYISYFIDDKSKIVVCGDLKFISSTIKKDIDLNFPKDKKIIVAGSTYKSEEKLLLEVFKEFKNNAVLVLAPRHLERLNEVINMVEENGYSYQLYSKITGNIDKQVLIVDKMGILPSLYKYADAVFIGGTIENIGGHNILEALVENKPVIIGKNYHKVKPLVEEFKDYIFIVENKEQLKDAIEKLFNQKNKNIPIKEKIDKIYKCYIKNLEKVINESRN